MFNPKQYRDKATEYSVLGKSANGPTETRKFEQLEKSFTALADNEQWLSENHQKLVRTPGADVAAGDALVDEEEHVLRCLGAALIMQWNTLPTKLRRELFDSAGTMGEMLNTAGLRGQIARFLHKHKDGNSDASSVATN